jgi:hypothetical protein
VKAVVSCPLTLNDPQVRVRRRWIAAAVLLAVFGAGTSASAGVFDDPRRYPRPRRGTAARSDEGRKLR